MFFKDKISTKVQFENQISSSAIKLIRGSENVVVHK